MMNVKDKMDMEYAKLADEVQRPNILLAGATGSGKSSLVNVVFGEALAKTGTGRPVTRHLQRFESPSVPLVLYDTVGYEVDLDARRQTVDEITHFAGGRDEANAGRRVHLVWYLVDVSKARVLDIDLELCARLMAEQIPVAVVLTKCDVASETEIDAVRRMLVEAMPGAAIFRVTTRVLPKVGRLELESLCEWSEAQLPLALQYAFVKAQRVSLRAKRRSVMAITAQHAAANAAVGATPIPFSDAPILMLSQSGMIARILYVYEMQGAFGSMQSLYKNLGGPLASLIGIKTAASLLKLFPGVGTVGGGVINSLVAGIITAALGYAACLTCERAHELALSGRESELTDLFKNLESHFTKTLGDVLPQIRRKGVGNFIKENS